MHQYFMGLTQHHSIFSETKYKIRLNESHVINVEFLLSLFARLELKYGNPKVTERKIKLHLVILG